jgi:hypothetical protein
VDLLLKSLDGQVLAKVAETYSGAMECFKVLHKVAFVAALEMEKDLPIELEEKASEAPAPLCPAPPAPPPCPSQAAQNSEPMPPKPIVTAPPKRGFVGLGVGAFWNVAPEAFFAPHLRVGWYVRPHVVLELDLTGQAWTTTRPQDGPTILDVQTGLATFAGCYAPSSFLLCGLVSTELRHTASGELDPDTKLLPSIGLRAGYEQSLVRSLSLRTNLDAAIYLGDRSIQFRTSNLWRPIPLALGVSTALVWTF